MPKTSLSPSQSFELDAECVLRSSLSPKLPWLQIGFGTRLSEMWPPGPAVRLKQVHSDRVVLVNEPWQLDAAPEADALVSNRDGFMLTVGTADCLPILIADERKRSVAAIHAGWRGTAAEISVKTLAQLSRNFDSRPEDLWVMLGPGIGKCCFEVGPDVSAQFSRFFPEQIVQGQIHLDLAETNRRQFTWAGVPPDRILVCAQCTRCKRELFHSWRRDGAAAGRMTSAVGISNLTG